MVKIEIPIYFSAGTYEDLDWACKLLESRDKTRRYDNCVQDQKNELENYYHVSRGYDLKNGSANFYLIKMKEIFQAKDFLPRIEHEYFHTVQQSLIGQKFRTNLPCWFLEGGPEYFGILTSSHGNETLFLQMRNSSILGAPEKRSRVISVQELTQWLTAASVPWLANLEIYVDQCAPFRKNGMYHDSILATEWMVEKIGVDGVLLLIKDAGISGWNASFEKHFGMPFDKGLVLMGEYMHKEILFAGENLWVLRPSCNAREPGPIQEPAGCWF